MWEIWANKLLPKVLKTCPKSNKSPNLVTLVQDVLSLDATALSIRSYNYQKSSQDVCLTRIQSLTSLLLL